MTKIELDVVKFIHSVEHESFIYDLKGWMKGIEEWTDTRELTIEDLYRWFPRCGELSRTNKEGILKAITTKNTNDICVDYRLDLLRFFIRNWQEGTLEKPKYLH